MSSLLEVDNLQVSYGDIVAAREVSLEATPGRCLALLGRNGAGKTTVLRGIAGLSTATASTLRFDGVDLAKQSVHRRAELGIAFVQEGKRIFRQRTVEENLLLGGHVLGLRRRALAERLDRAYDRFPILAERRSMLAGAMSGGQQQMLAIATALVPSPRLVMLDEPSAGLAPTIVADVLDVIRSLKDDNIAVVLVEQALAFAMAVGDDVAVMDLGRVVHRGTTADADTESKVHEAYMGGAPGRTPVSTGSAE